MENSILKVCLIDEVMNFFKVTKDNCCSTGQRNRHFLHSISETNGKIICIVFMCSLLFMGTVVSGQPGDLIIDSFQYASPSAAQAVWFSRPWTLSDAGQPVYPAVVDGENGLVMPFEYPVDTILRAAWYRYLSLDMSAYTHLQFRINGGDGGEAVGMCVIGFQTGSGGWVRSEFDLLDHWQTVRIPLADFVQSSGPVASGWDNIQSVQISPWKDWLGTGSITVSDMRAIACTSNNLLPNGSFEIANTEALPDYWGSGGNWALIHEPWVVDTDEWRSHWGIDTTEYHSGLQSLRISSSGDATQLQAVSNQLKLKAGQTYTLSVYLKSNQSSLPVLLQLGPEVFQTVYVDNTWHRYEISRTVAAEPEEGIERSAMINLLDVGTLWIDDVQLEAGSTATAFQASPLDEAIDTDVVHRTPRTIDDYPYAPGPEAVSVEIDSNRCLLVDGKPFIPIVGFLASSSASYPSLAVFQEFAKNGFNTIKLRIDNASMNSSEIWSILDDAKACGLKVIFHVDNAISSSVFESWLANLKYHPAIIVWYVYDEPYTTETWEAALERYDIAKTEDPSRPAYINALFNSIPPDGWTSDILGTDYYPLPDRAPAKVIGYVDFIEQNAAVSGKPVWMVLQLPGYCYDVSREPTGPELECMSYLSLVYGARGLLYWTDKPRSDELWKEVRALADEVRKLTPALYSIAVPPVVSVNTSHIRLLSKCHGGRNYIIAINESHQQETAEFTIPNPASFNIDVLFEDRLIQGSNGTFSDTFAGYQRHVYSYRVNKTGYWQFDGTANDSSLNHNDLTLYGASYDPDAVSGSSLSFDGTDDYLVSQQPIAMPDQFTISAWVKIQDQGHTTYIIGNAPCSRDGFVLNCNNWDTSNRKLSFSTSNGLTTCAATTGINAINFNQWHYIVCVVDRQNGTASIYVDGVDKTVSNTILTDFAVDSNIYIGKSSTQGLYFKGNMDEVKIEDRLYSPEEAVAEGYWQFDSSPDDSSPNHNDLTLYGASYDSDAVSGSSLSFDGTDDYLVSQQPITMPDQFTISAWVKIQDQGHTTYIIGNAPCSRDGFVLNCNNWDTSNRKLSFSTSNGLTTCAATTGINAINFNQWHYIVCLVNRQNGTASIYVDGVDKTVSNTILTDFAVDSNIYIGKSQTQGLYFKGNMDEVKIKGGI